MAIREMVRRAIRLPRIRRRNAPSAPLAISLILAGSLGAQSGDERRQREPPTQGDSHRLSGTVESNGQPIPGATVQAVRGDLVLATLTDEAGRFALNEIPPGGWEICVTTFGFESARREVRIEEAPVKIVFALHMDRPGRPFPDETDTGRHGGEDDGSAPAGSCGRPLHETGRGNDALPPASGNLTGEFATELAPRVQSPDPTARGQADAAAPSREGISDSQIHWGYFYDPRTSLLDAAPYSLNGQKNRKPAELQNLFGLNISVPVRGSRRLRIETILLSANYESVRISSRRFRRIPAHPEDGRKLGPETVVIGR